jgi:hypothetical protein
MQPMPDIRDNYYNNAPTPAVFNDEYNKRCLFNNENYQKITANNNIQFDNTINSIQQMNFKQNEYNNKELIDKNVDQVPKENLEKEITLVIDSMDRDIDLYPNSFDFRVKFNPSSGDKQPYINKKLENITYVRLDGIILPNYYRLVSTQVDTASTNFDDDIINILNISLSPNTDVIYSNNEDIIIIWYNLNGNNLTIDFFDNNDTLKHEKVYSAVVDVTNGSGALVTADISSFLFYTYKVDNPTTISSDRFIHLEIDELKNVDEYSTDVNLGQSFGTLYHEGEHCHEKLSHMKSHFSELYFSSSNLLNISSLTIKLYSSFGEALNSSSNKNFDITNKTKLNEYINNDVKYVSASKYIRHPLYLHSQCHFIIKVRYLIPSINKINFN